MKNKTILFVALIITLVIFLSLVFLSGFLDDQRERVVLERMNNVVEDYEQMQSLLLMSELFGEEATCVALSSALAEMNNELWELGIKIDSYRQATEEFFEDPFYQEQKRKFNSQQVLYFTLLTKMNEKCPVEQTVVSYFYRKKENCPDCDEQAFVLLDLKKELENRNINDEVAVFSFDADMGLPPIDVMIRFYNVSDYPCVVVGNQSHCGLHDKINMLELLCDYRNIALCE